MTSLAPAPDTDAIIAMFTTFLETELEDGELELNDRFQMRIEHALRLTLATWYSMPAGFENVNPTQDPILQPLDAGTARVNDGELLIGAETTLYQEQTPALAPASAPEPTPFDLHQYRETTESWHQLDADLAQHQIIPVAEEWFPLYDYVSLQQIHLPTQQWLDAPPIPHPSSILPVSTSFDLFSSQPPLSPLRFPSPVTNDFPSHTTDFELGPGLVQLPTQEMLTMDDVPFTSSSSLVDALEAENERGDALAPLRTRTRKGGTWRERGSK